MTLTEAVQHFISTLDPQARPVITSLLLSPQIEPSLEWYARVAALYLTGPEGELLKQQIEQEYPDEAVWKELDSSSGFPIFEAGILLRCAQLELRKQSGLAS